LKGTANRANPANLFLNEERRNFRKEDSGIWFLPFLLSSFLFLLIRGIRPIRGAF